MMCCDGFHFRSTHPSYSAFDGEGAHKINETTVEFVRNYALPPKVDLEVSITFNHDILKVNSFQNIIRKLGTDF